MMSWLSTMKFFWWLSERHWLLKPFELIGDWMEDYGLDHGYIQFNDEIMKAIDGLGRDIEEYGGLQVFPINPKAG